MLELQEKLLEIERDRINGAKYYTVDELEQPIRGGAERGHGSHPGAKV